MPISMRALFLSAVALVGAAGCKKSQEQATSTPATSTMSTPADEPVPPAGNAPAASGGTANMVTSDGGAVAAAPGADAGTAVAAAGGGAEAEAAQVFSTRCTTCHGPQGEGNGPASMGLNPKPRNFKDKEWQKSVTDEHIEKIIALGGPAVGKSPAMPPNPDLVGKPVIQSLRAHIRNLGK